MVKATAESVRPVQIPHDGPMLFVNSVSITQRHPLKGTVTAHVHKDLLCFDEESLHSLWLLEIMAQGIAAVFSEDRGADPQQDLGLLIAIDHCTWETAIVPEGPLTLTIDILWRQEFGSVAVWQTEILWDNNVLARGQFKCLIRNRQKYSAVP